MKSVVVALATEAHATRELAASLANGLQEAGRSSTLIWALQQPDRAIAPPPVSPGIAVLIVKAADTGRAWIPDFPLLRLARQIAPKLDEFEIVYGLTSGHPLMHAIQAGRHSSEASPYFVSIVDEVETEQDDPGLSASAIACRFGEVYVLKYCDLIVLLGATGRQRLESLGVTPQTSRVMWSSIGRLQAVFDAAESNASTRSISRSEQSRLATPTIKSLLSICISHSDRSGDATRVLQALDRQTSDNFSLIAVDTSTSVRSTASFAQLAERYERRGWTFRGEPQSGEARAISLSVEDATGEYLMFLDTDDAPEPRLVERALEAIALSGDDLLEIWSSQATDGDELPEARNAPISSQSGPVRASYGLDLVNAMGGHGDCDPVFLLRRTAFDAVGGYPEGLVAGCERQALAVRVALAGYRTDVLPEILNARHVNDDGAPHDPITAGEALRRAFDERLKTINMQSFGLAFQYIDQQRRVAEQDVETRRRALTRRFAHRTARDRLRLLMVVSHLPYPPIGGSLLRWWAMIRFLGQRHDLTLVSFCSPEQSRQRHPLLRYCRSIYAADWGGRELPGAEAMPLLVRTRMRVTMRDALRALPSDLYDVALIEQIFLASFHTEVKAPIILGEHNIESQLLAQVAQTDLRSPLTTGFKNPQNESNLLRSYEDRMWPQFPMRSAVSPHERDEIQRRAKTGQTILVENGTNPELWLANAQPGTDCVVFFGNLGYYPNIDGILHFWQDIWPHLLARRPGARFIVAGGAATADLRDLARQQGFTLIEDPTQIRDVAILASVSVVPLRLGAGTRLKILDSMALGLPVVSTSIGCLGLTVEDGDQLLIRDDAVDFAEAVARLLGSRDLWQRLRENGKTVIDANYRWDKVLAPLESALWSLAG